MTAKPNGIREAVETGLGSSGRLKILRVLASKESASHTKYSLEKLTGLKSVDVRKHLKVLVEAGWVKEHAYNPQTYTLNADNPAIRALREFFEKTGYL